jgi:hypothetical protein
LIRRHAVLHVATIALVAAVALPTAAPARTSACRSASEAPGVKILARDKVGVVFRKGDGVNKGCVYGGVVHKLSYLYGGSEARLRGPFAMYTYEGNAIGDETNKLGVYDLRTGKRERLTSLDSGPVRELETNSYLTDFAVNRRGVPVWVMFQLNSERQPNGKFELHAADGSAHKERVVDVGKIGKKSLSLSRDGKTIHYTKNGSKQTAPLRG